MIGLSDSGCQGKIGGKNNEGIVLPDAISARAADDSTLRMRDGEEGAFSHSGILRSG